MRKVFLDDLPKWKEGTNKGRINWKESIKYKINGTYNDMEFEIQIKKYQPKEQTITIEYNNKYFTIKTSSLIQCKLGRILGEITSEFKIEIGTRYQDKNRDITIIDREHRQKTYIRKNGMENNCNNKWYKYKCNKCGWTEGWIIESSLIKGVGCSCCTNNTPVLGINTIWDTDKWLIPIVKNDEFCKTHTHGCSDSILPTCPDCLKQRKKKVTISSIYNSHSIGCPNCSDGISYGEKIMFPILNKLRIEFQTQLSKSTFKWCNQYRYDFYFELNNKKYIIETHGNQHYEDAWDKLEKTQLNDELKKNLAITNGIKEENYIVIDCRYSTLDWIKNSILESRLNELFDLSIIDWSKCHEFALSNLVKVACEYKNNDPNITTTQISKIMKLHRNTINGYLKQGNKLSWCVYDGKNEQSKIWLKNKKILIIFRNEIFLGIFESCSELERRSKELFGVKLYQRNISTVCRGKRNTTGGYNFKYIEDLTKEEYIKYDIENKLKELYNQELVQAV